jgi:large subunit ribosomal protein L4
MKIDILDKTGKSVSKMDLDPSVFGAKINKSLMAQYIRIYGLNQRQGTTAVKDRSEVRGGGRKPWKQKGTGRARHGSIRSPIWRGGGIVHGPQPKSWKLSLSKKMKKAAIISFLSLKASKKDVVVLDKLDIKKPSTKVLVELLKKLKLGGKTLLVLDKNNDVVLKSAGNIEKLNVRLAENLNGYDLMHCDDVLFVKDAVEMVTSKYKGKVKK